MDPRLKRLLIYYASSALGVLIVLTVAIVSRNYVMSLDQTYDELQSIQTNKLKLGAEIKEKEALLARVISMTPAGNGKEATEGAILRRVDAIMSRMKGAAVVLADFDQKDNETVLPLTINSVIGNYTVFLDELQYLQTMDAPFFFIQSISLSKTSPETGGSIKYDIKGVLKHQSRPTDGAV